VTLEVDVTARIGAFALRAELAVGDGVPLALVGPNGAGKSSLLLAILGIVQPSDGRITLDGEVLYDAASGTSLPPEDRGLGYVPQNLALFPHMTVRRNIEFALACRDGAAGDPGHGRDRADQLLGDLELRALGDRRPSTLSGGERQRVALARALATGPRALLLDEPLAALDVAARVDVRSFVSSALARLAVPAIVVTHDLDDAAALGARIAVLERGRLAQVGTVDEIRARPASPFVEALVRA
jgi:molybdate transport system ATP-binding protein